ncbi:aquaporin-8-like [Styela clava]|uniref:aquaporin-8-like n=1 Tax=Styela clava TaxID=7725 RepID=UPI001939A253|nr:aquaporin-8-like [Styela clava]
MGNSPKDMLQKYRKSSYRDIAVHVIIPLLAEFFAMVLHTFWGSMYTSTTKTITVASLNRTIHPDEWKVEYLTSTLVPAFQAGFAVWMFIVLFWKICVINFNPAISTCLLISGDLNPWLYLPYIIMQIIGSALGAVIAQAIKNDDPGPFLISDDANISAIIAYEIMATGIMCFFTNVMVGDKSYDQATGAFAIGMTVFQGIIGGRWIGAGCLNAARAVGPAIVMGGYVWKHHWVWWVGDILGGVVFALIYRAFFAPPDKVWIVQIGKFFCKSNKAGGHRRTSREEVTIGEDKI